MQTAPHTTQVQVQKHTPPTSHAIPSHAIPSHQSIQIDCSAIQPTPHPNASPTIRNINPTRPTTQPASSNRATCSRTTATQPVNQLASPLQHPSIHRAHIDDTPDTKTEKAPKESKQASPASPRQIPSAKCTKAFQRTYNSKG